MDTSTVPTPRIPTFREYMYVQPRPFDRRSYGRPNSTFVWMGMVMPSVYREPADSGTMGDPYNGRVVPKKYLAQWQARYYAHHYPDAPAVELAAARSFAESAQTA